jgi:Uma2 family endonuclease
MRLRAGLALIMATAELEQAEAKRLWTYNEMAAELPESNLPTELWDGEIVMSAAPRLTHQRVVAQLWRTFADHVNARALGEVFISPVDVVFSERKAVQPDLVFVSEARRSILSETCIRGVPDLLVEVISEGTWRRDRVDKKALYEQFGVSEYWIVDPDARLIEVFTLVEGIYRQHSRGLGDESARSKLLPGLSVSFAWMVR